ncbi:rhamnulokinase [Candidatus Sumerlaeota bacterium]|nr:rhamnulokinase [Candidatus Sumerlaeota bacterium]
MHKIFLAVDLGAESGRLIRTTIDKNAIALEEVHRFRTQGLVMHGVRQWDITRIYEEIINGLTKAAQMDGPAPSGIGIDTWGVDFGFLMSDGSVLSNPVHYRDARTEGMIDAANAIVPLQEIYDRTGIMTLPFNSLFQLLALVKAQSPALQAAAHMQFIGPLLGCLLTGKTTCEYTIASTAQMLNAKTRDWDYDLLKRLQIPTHFLGEITPPGTVVGPVSAQVARETGLDPSVPFISTAVHDTACAVAAMPVDESIGGDWAYLSSGTWSLIGAELNEPVISEATHAAGFTNEGGVGGTIRFLKNIFGLWLVQECRRTWLAEAGGDESGLDYATLTAEAEASEPFRSVIPLDDPRLFAPESMPAAIAAICGESGVPVPETRGQFIRCALESLALSYRKSLDDMDGLLGRKTNRLHIGGGGVKNRLLCQLTADACGIPVYAGPVEATALGNVLVQGMATGVFASLAAGRRAIRESQPVEVYQLGGDPRWSELLAK